MGRNPPHQRLAQRRQFRAQPAPRLVVGGIGTRWGPMVGAVPLMWLSQSLGRYADYSLLIFGVLYGGVLLFLPRGLCGEVLAWARQRSRATA